MDEMVILVDENDRPRGVMEKMEAHRRAELHRAFSVFIFNSNGEMLLQRRAAEKYHSAGLYTNTCCSHPRPGEDTLAAANRRLKEEMGMEAKLTRRCFFIYKTTFENGLTENELDHVFEGTSDEVPVPDPKEVQSFEWVGVDEIKQRIADQPGAFTYWFRLAIRDLY